MARKIKKRQYIDDIHLRIDIDNALHLWSEIRRIFTVMSAFYISLNDLSLFF